MSELQDFLDELPNHPIETERTYPVCFDVAISDVTPSPSFFPSANSFTEYCATLVVEFDSGRIALLFWEPDSAEWCVESAFDDPDDPRRTHSDLVRAVEEIADSEFLEAARAAVRERVR